MEDFFKEAKKVEENEFVMVRRRDLVR